MNEFGIESEELESEEYKSFYRRRVRVGTIKFSKTMNDLELGDRLVRVKNEGIHCHDDRFRN